MSEVPAMALIILAAYFFYKYFEQDKERYAVATVITLILSVYTKQLAIFIFPVFIFYLLIFKGPRKLIQKEMIVYYLITIILMLPLVFITLKYSSTNVEWVTKNTLEQRISLTNLIFFPNTLWKNHLSLPTLVLSLTSILLSIYKRDRKSTIFLFWIISLYVFLISLGIHKNPRYAIYSIPAFCIFAGSSIRYFQDCKWKIIVLFVLITAIGYQFVEAYNKDNEYANGYEEAAKYIVENNKGDSVLYGNVYDTGYLIFYVRKYDKDRDMIILRSDKLFATSNLVRIVEDRIKGRSEIYEALHDYGVKYVVIEDTEALSPALELFRNETKTSSKFKLVKKVSVKSSHPAANNVTIGIYEYRNYRPSNGDKMLDMKIPLMGDSIRVPFNELKKKPENFDTDK